MRFLMPLAHVVCDSNKSRAMIGYLTTDNFEPGKIPDSDAWFMPADFGDDQAREAQADVLDGIDVASIFSGSKVVIPMMFQFNIVLLSLICSH